MDLSDAPLTPRVYGLPIGVDFPVELVAGLRARMADQPPHAMARAIVIVNTARMKRRIHDLFAQGAAGFLPRILLLSDLANLPGAGDVPAPVPSLRRRLELVQLVAGLLDRQPDLAARASVYDLADSLARLMEEMQDEAVSADVIRDLDVSDLSGHWARAQAFFDIAARFVGSDQDAPDASGHMRRVVEALRDHWAASPPAAPVILAGSTASRGSTIELAQAVAGLPQGAIVLPGYDFGQPDEVWEQLARDPNEDHPQFRFSRLMRRLEISPAQIRPWTSTPPKLPARNRLLSLALRPAPVTDAWMRDGPGLQDLIDATADVTLVEATSPREEALTIAMRLREAAQTGQRAALITPDRMLTRQVSAALQRWDILPDDSAGTPLHLSAPGRFLRHIASFGRKRIDSGTVLTVLKHPLCHSGADRGAHLILTRDLELHLRSKGIPFPDAEELAAWASARGEDGADAWGAWVSQFLCTPPPEGAQPATDWLSDLWRRAEALAAGPGIEGSGELWLKNAGQKALTVLTELADELPAAGSMNAAEFGDLLGAVLSTGQVRDRDAPHPDIMIWGTLEARVGGADLVILGGLNEGTWPAAASPDPWLNRPMRQRAGLLVPERQIGLSAHDFQQAMGETEVWLTRSAKSDDAETVASRWVNRLTNLLSGLKTNQGDQALKEMRARGQRWLGYARRLEEVEPVALARRPSPRPPVSARPRRLSVTRIKTLVRDPYAIYAREILRLRPLNPLVRAPDGLLRGIVVHAILEDVVGRNLQDPSAMIDVAQDVLARDVPWAATRSLWAARLGRIAPGFLQDEAARRALAAPAHVEIRMRSDIPQHGFTLTAQADRIDRQPDGRLRIYDYKTGTVPTKKVQEAFDKQLLLEAAMAERGGIEGDTDPQSVAGASFLGVGSKLSVVDAPLDDHPPGQVWQELTELIGKYMQPDQGYTARRAMQKDSDRSDYDHLARFGEWDYTSAPDPEDLT